jgi:hypothetical protein
MSYTHDQEKWSPNPPKKKFDPLAIILVLAIAILIYLLIRYHAILFPTLFLFK